MSYVGKCLCGQIQFSIDAKPQGARMCWCHDCQRIASGSATVNVLFPEEAVRYTGQMTTLRLTADSGNIVERGFVRIADRRCTARQSSLVAGPCGSGRAPWTTLN